MRATKQEPKGGSFTHRLFCSESGILTKPFRRFATRPVKHKRLYVALYGVLPRVFMLAAGVFAGVQWINLVDEWALKLNGFAGFLVWFVVTFMPYLSALWLITKWGGQHFDLVYRRAFEVDLDPLGVDDLGEYLEAGEIGWRRLRFNFAVTQGSGRLARPSLEWLEFAVNPEDQRTKAIGASSPNIAGEMRAATGVPE